MAPLFEFVDLDLNCIAGGVFVEATKIIISVGSVKGPSQEGAGVGIKRRGRLMRPACPGQQRPVRGSAHDGVVRRRIGHEPRTFTGLVGHRGLHGLRLRCTLRCRLAERLERPALGYAEAGSMQFAQCE